jgi:hypothetical protein
MRHAPLLEFEPQFGPESIRELTMVEFRRKPFLLHLIEGLDSRLKSFTKDTTMCRSNKSVRFRGSTSLFSLTAAAARCFSHCELLHGTRATKCSL